MFRWDRTKESADVTWAWPQCSESPQYIFDIQTSSYISSYINLVHVECRWFTLTYFTCQVNINVSHFVRGEKLLARLLLGRQLETCQHFNFLLNYQIISRQTLQHRDMKRHTWIKKNKKLVRNEKWQQLCNKDSTWTTYRLLDFILYIHSGLPFLITDNVSSKAELLYSTIIF